MHSKMIGANLTGSDLSQAKLRCVVVTNIVGAHLIGGILE